MGELDHVRWLGGGTGAGKTTISRRLAKRFGVSLYSTDETMAAHAARLDAGAAPLLAQFRSLDMDQRWVTRPPGEMYRTFPWFHGEGFELVIEDLRAAPSDRIIIAEGFRLLPGLVRPHLSNPGHAVWLLPSTQFTRQAFLARNKSEAFWRQTSDPDQALTNLLARDSLFAETIAADTKRHGLAGLRIDGSSSIDATTTTIGSTFGL